LYAPISFPCYMHWPSHPPWSDHANTVWWGAEIIKLLIMQFYTTSCYFIPLRSKYSLQHPVLKRLSLCSSLNVREHVSHPHKTTDKIIVVYDLLAYFHIIFEYVKKEYLFQPRTMD
jgi:hypothetical protein